MPAGNVLGHACRTSDDGGSDRGRLRQREKKDSASSREPCSRKGPAEQACPEARGLGLSTPSLTRHWRWAPPERASDLGQEDSLQLRAICWRET